MSRQQVGSSISIRNHRPRRVASLFYQGDAYPGWEIHNWNKRRFYLVNLRYVMDVLQIGHTQLSPFLFAATHVIHKETDWSAQFKGDYSCSKVQVFPGEYHKPKLFHKAATIIVAMELVAKEKDSEFNVYDYMRILPSFYFVDHFDHHKLSELKDYFDSLSIEDKKAFGDPSVGRSVGSEDFETVCHSHLGQVGRTNLLEEIARGHCVTRYVAGSLVNFVNTYFPPQHAVGPVLQAGDESAISVKLGSLDAAASQRVPQIRAPQDLPPIEPEPDEK